jgi:hypothetical protein
MSLKRSGRTNVVSVAVIIGPHVTFKCPISVYDAIFILFMGEEGQTCNRKFGCDES